MSKILLRNAEIKDAEQILKLYAPYVERTPVSFELQVPLISEMQQRIASISSQFPFLVAEIEGHVIGYCYASSYRDRMAYAWNCETSIYIAQNFFGKQLASLLYSKLLEELQQRNFIWAYGVIALPNEKSVNFHKKMGFIPVFTYEKVGYKFDQWWDVLWMRKELNKPENYARPVIKTPYSLLLDIDLDNIDIERL